jgi:hypothetical protein
MKYLLIILLSVATLLSSCEKLGKEKMSTIPETYADNVIAKLKKSLKTGNFEHLERGVKQVAKFWTQEDGTKEEFENFCINNFVASQDTLDILFQKLSKYFESIYGNYNKLSLELSWTMQVQDGDIMPIDLMFSGYDPSSHLHNDLFKNKIAFYTILNFPFYSLGEKNNFGKNWTRKQWAYARIGDIFTSRIPADIIQNIAETLAKADNYIANYNIYVGYLIDDKGNIYFNKNKKLITHWNLRDELKAQYANPDGLAKQKMIYEVMNRIVTQTIPEPVINSNEYTWNPISNKVYKDGKEIKVQSEPNTRYKYLLDLFKAQEAEDKYCPFYPTYIERSFARDMEIPQPELKQIFINLVSSPTVKNIAALIKKRLGRDLQPFDIWYDGFKARSTISEEELSTITRKKYPTPDAFAAKMPEILTKLGFTKEKAHWIAAHIQVDPSRGAGHAAGAQMKNDKAHLRTRVAANGMNYKGYNIAVHEFGHNVEQTITLQDIDYYMLHGIPNTAFTEAIAFLFQKRDLELLGIENSDPMRDYFKTLDNFWSAYEIMGVSLVDMGVWKWLYKHPKATPEQLKKATIKIAKDIWNKYYAEVFGIKDQPILAVYSHMIVYPLYLSAYPVGNLIEFQLEQNFKGKNFADELTRCLLVGRITPEVWMHRAVDQNISVKALIDAAEESLEKIK